MSFRVPVFTADSNLSTADIKTLAVCIVFLDPIPFRSDSQQSKIYFYWCCCFIKSGGYFCKALFSWIQGGPYLKKSMEARQWCRVQTKYSLYTICFICALSIGFLKSHIGFRKCALSCLWTNRDIILIEQREAIKNQAVLLM